MMEYIWIIGSAIVVVVALQALWVGLDMLRRSAQERVVRGREATLFDLRVKSARKRVKAEQQKSLQWAGSRKFVVQRKEAEDPNGDICSFYLEAHDGKPIPAFEPGQFLTFHMRIPGQSDPVVRCYSLSDSPNKDYYRVSIKRVPPPRNAPDAPAGLVSNHFHDNVKEGDILDVGNPAGAFYLDMANERPVVLIGGGVGLTPVMSMVNAIIESGSSRETWFFYGVRNKAEHAMKEHLEGLARGHDHIHLQICYSNPTDDCVEGADYQYAERVGVELFKRVLPSNNYDYYMCGPPPMMDSIVEGLNEWGVPKSSVNLEAFGPAAGTKNAKKLNPDATGPAVAFNRSGKTANWDEGAGDLWNFAKAAGVDIASGCLKGSCGTCITAIISGEVEYDSPPDFECEDGSCLVCCCKPKGEIKLDA